MHPKLVSLVLASIVLIIASNVHSLPLAIEEEDQRPVETSDRADKSEGSIGPAKSRPLRGRGRPTKRDEDQEEEEYEEVIVPIKRRPLRGHGRPTAREEDQDDEEVPVKSRALGRKRRPTKDDQEVLEEWIVQVKKRPRGHSKGHSKKREDDQDLEEDQEERIVPVKGKRRPSKAREEDQEVWIVPVKSRPQGGRRHPSKIEEDQEETEEWIVSRPQGGRGRPDEEEEVYEEWIVPVKRRSVSGRGPSKKRAEEIEEDEEQMETVKGGRSRPSPRKEDKKEIVSAKNRPQGDREKSTAKDVDQQDVNEDKIVQDTKQQEDVQ